MLNDLLLNFTLLIAGLFAVSLTYGHPDQVESWKRQVVRYGTTVGLALLLLLNSVPLIPGLLFDFRSVPIALAARRYGVLAGLLVAAPIAVYRLLLGGPGAPAGVINLVLVAVLAGWRVGLFRSQVNLHTVHEQWWGALRLYAVANLVIFPAVVLTGRPLLDAWPTYLLVSSLSALGLLGGHVVIQTRLRALTKTKELEQLAFADPLTGSLNRRRFDDDFAAAPQPAFLLLLDLDHFKRVNDTYGHEVGDQVLVQMAQLLRETVRPTDSVYRLGGEEFAVMLAPCDESAAPRVAERIRAAVARDLAQRSGMGTDMVTVSGGWVRMTDDKSTTMRAADELLYAAKNGGRNCMLSVEITAGQTVPTPADTSFVA
ncbi:diguanylate cyclase [Deinococcus sp. QL22]|uniref:diguanylate cyclase n=1 Tax=Deinococcus sp. QL22 TaxID=2939437 RepID=UPI002017C39D|nr:diguanylate cyclase [Deinococcus sp. QL22]UQN10186.1 diguanylate cyclase [Deinococcus sp. QL22]